MARGINLGIGYFKAEPAEYARISAGGRKRKEGNGVASFYLEHNTSIELVSTTTSDQAFGFREISKDNQEINVQGGFMYRITEPEKALAAYNFSIDPKTKRYVTEDAKKLPENLIQVIRASARRAIQKTPLEELLTMSDVLSKKVSEELAQSGLTDGLGIKVETLYITAIKPMPEIEKALGTQYRENLLQKADEAIYGRRAKAIEQERAIQENELSNKISLEQKKAELVKLQGDNAIAEAKYDTEASKMAMSVFDTMDPEKLRAHALYQIGKNANRIETLTITPELLAGIKNGR